MKIKTNKKKNFQTFHIFLELHTNKQVNKPVSLTKEHKIHILLEQFTVIASTSCLDCQ